MICGNFTTTEQGFTGEIRFFGFLEKVELRRIESKDSDKAPDFRIVPVDNLGIEFGAAWSKTSKEKRNYLSLKLCPVFGQPVYLRLFETVEDPGKFELVASN
jgi:uncharacterized protein (DUF736 family)